MEGQRALFFATTLNLLASAADIDQQHLQAVANAHSTQVESFQLPFVKNYVLDPESIDNHALHYIPDDAPSNQFPIKTKPDGNCFYNAISIALIGNESLAIELRVRTALALLQLKDEILKDNQNMVTDLLKEQILLYSPFAETDYRLPSTNPSKEQLAYVFENEVRSTLQNYSWAGMWQIQGLATAINVSIWSVYPMLNLRIRQHFNRLITPILPYGSSIDVLTILWSGNIQSNGQFKANHFVPLVDCSRFRSIACETNNEIKQPNTSFINERQTVIDKSSQQPNIQSMSPLKEKKYNSICDTLRSFWCKESLPKYYCSCCQQLILTTNPKSSSNAEQEVSYLCSTCSYYIKRHEKCPLSIAVLDPGPIPAQLKHLNTTEINIISLIHPYMNLVKLPVGGQFAQKGQSINIPIPVQEISRQLPTSPTDSYVIVDSPKPNRPTHLIDTKKIFQALKWLKQNNRFYTDITITKQSDNNVFGMPISNEEKESKGTEENSKSSEDRECIRPSQPPTKKQKTESALDAIEDDTAKYADVSLIPNDYTIPIHRQQFPMEDDSKNLDHPKYTLPYITEQPINIFQHPNFEELAFPTLYPFGLHGFKRSAQPTLKQYFTCRITNKDNRWSASIPYLFWALNVYEQHQLQSSISIAMRLKASSHHQVQVKDILTNDYQHHIAEDFRFMKQMKGTAAYWREQLYDLLAKMSILGPPTFFVSLSSNDSNWLELYTFIDQSLTEQEVQMKSPGQRAEILRKNPVKSALYFSKRRENFLRSFILGPTKPLGNITDYFSRTEFQNRGSPHIHAFFCVEGAPNMETTKGREKAAEFIDTHISAKVPPETDILHDTVTKLQTHHHTQTCFKTNTNKHCRFDFPRACSTKTEIAISNISITTGRFYKLERPENSIWINPYNPSILAKWNANMDIQIVGCKNAAAAYVCTYVCKNEPDSLKQALSSAIKKIPSNASIRKRLSRIGNVLLTHRLISAQEAAYRLLNISMVSSSKETIFINSSVPMKHYKILKPKKELEELPSDSNKIFKQTMHEIYEKRPKEQFFESMCLAHFGTHYVLLRSNEKVQVKKSNLKRFQLQTVPVQYIREKKQTACFRTFVPKLTKDPEAHFHALLCLFLPWRNHEELLLPYKTYQESYMKKQHLLHQDAVEKFKYGEKLTTAVQHIQRLSQNNKDDMHCTVTPAVMESQLHADLQSAEYIGSAFVPKNYDDTEDYIEHTKTSFTDDEFRSLSQYLMSDDEYTTKLEACTDEQKKSLNLVDKAISGDNSASEHLRLFITGGAGSGKSFLLQILREHILRKNKSFLPNVIVAAPTGVAAFNINAWTLHHLLHLDVQHKNQATYTPLSAKQLEKMRRLFRDVNILIIDEISMVSINTLLHIHKRLSEIKDTNSDDNAFFGNMHVIVFGDLFQLRPVYGGSIFKDHPDMPFMHLWKDLFWFVELTENIRQSSDKSYAQLLNRIREGTHTRQDIKTLLDCKKQTNDACMSEQHIYPTKEQCKQHNHHRLIEKSKKGRNLYDIIAHDDVPDSEIPSDDTFCGGLPKQITACVNAKVMLLRNISTSDGLVNGAQGNIVKFNWPNGKNQEYVGQAPSSIEVLFDDPRVGAFFNQSKHKPITIKPISVSFYNDNHVSVTRTQFPLTVSYAVTVHKVQGLTLKRIAIDIGQSTFTAGQAYVALSRVSSIKDVIVLDIDPNRIYASENVKEEMLRLRTERNIFDK